MARYEGLKPFMPALMPDTFGRPERHGRRIGFLLQMDTALSPCLIQEAEARIQMRRDADQDLNER